MSGSNPARKSVDQLLSDFDNLGTGAAAAGGAASSTDAAHKDAQSLLDDLDSLVQTPRAPTSAAAASSRAATSTTAAAPASASASAPASQSQAGVSASSASAAAPDSSVSGGGGTWGSWGAVWNSAARLADQARAELEKRAPPLTVSGISADGSIQTEKPVPSAQAEEASANAAQAANAAAAAAQGVLGRGFKFAEGVRGFVKESGWDKIGEDISRVGRKGLKDIINAVAPPIAAHEVLQVTLSHDMIGYDGIETVVFQVLAKVMDQVERNDIEHQLVVNKAPKGGSAPKQQHDEGAEQQERDLNAVEGFDAAFKLAEAELDALIKARPPPKQAPTPTPEAGPSAAQPATEGGAPGTSAAEAGPGAGSLTLPITECPLFIRVQPLFAPLPGYSAAASGAGAGAGAESTASKHLFFVIVLQDPLHGLRHQVISQSVPWSWMEVPFHSNAWVESALVDVLHGALSIVGQDYVHGRSVAGAA